MKAGDAHQCEFPIDDIAAGTHEEIEIAAAISLQHVIDSRIYSSRAHISAPADRASIRKAALHLGVEK